MDAISPRLSETAIDVNLPYADPSDSLGHLTRVAFRRFARALERRTMQHGVSSGQWRFLRVLWQEDGISQRDLSHRVDMREPTTVVALKGLEKKGFVVRERDGLDRRKVRVYLTEEARSLHNRMIPYLSEVHALAAAGLSATEIATAKRVLLVLSDNLSPNLASES